MSLSQSPNIVTNGLVFAYDENNTKSYKGPPLRNHIQTISPQTSSATGFVLTGGSEVADIPTLGQTNVSFSNYQNINSGGSVCCVSFMNYGNTGNIFTGSTLYTYLILYRTDSGYTHPNWMYRYEYNSSGTYQTEAGVHDNSRRTYLGNGWYYAWGTFTTQPATTNLQCYSFTYNYSSFNDKISVAKVCILPGNYSGLHPKFWPDTATTRSNTESILDLTNNNTITATSLTYASDGTFSFNGSTNHIITTNAGMSHGTGNFTYSCWAKFAALPGLGTIFENGFYTNGILIRFETNVIRIYAQYSTTTYTNAFSFIPTVGQWYHLVITRVGNNLLLYSNGVLLSTISFGTSINVVPSNNLMFIGMSQHQAGQCFNGQIANAQVYNQALSAAEVQQNFNALRGRYGI